MDLDSNFSLAITNQMATSIKLSRFCWNTGHRRAQHIVYICFIISSEQLTSPHGRTEEISKEKMKRSRQELMTEKTKHKDCQAWSTNGINEENLQ